MITVQCQTCQKPIPREEADTTWTEKTTKQGTTHECTYRCKDHKDPK